MVKMREKLELLKEGVFVMSHMVTQIPEIEIITYGTSQYYLDKDLIKTATDIEFYANTYSERVCIYLYKDIDFYTGENTFFTKRIYASQVFNYEICSLKNKTILFTKDYYDDLIQLIVQNSVLTTIQLKLIELISSNKYDINKDSLPKKLKILLPFI